MVTKIVCKMTSLKRCQNGSKDRLQEKHVLEKQQKTKMICIKNEFKDSNRMMIKIVG